MTSVTGKRAFSLMELLIVLALLGLLASISLPALHSWQKRIELDKANSALLELITEAKRRASRDGITWFVRTLRTPACLTLEQVEGHRPQARKTSTDLADTRILPDSMEVEFYRLDADRDADRPLKELAVNSTGQCTPVRIWILQNGQRIQSYEIDRLTGSLRRGP